jgi:ActR/RegA family two-component response regulator
VTKKRLRWPLLGIHSLESVKASYIRYVVDATGGNISEAARLLKIHRATVSSALSGGDRP